MLLMTVKPRSGAESYSLYSIQSDTNFIAQI